MGGNYPVYFVTWYDAVRFCNALSTLIGMEPVYNESTWEADFTKNGFYLPTEAQWEYAAGGPNHYDWSLSDTFDTWDYACSVSPQFLGGTIAVKSHPANGFGLYDMSGNVWEWCHDWVGSTFPHTGETDPNGPVSGAYRIFRGGSWFDTYLNNLRCDARHCTSPGSSSSHIGFRVSAGGHGLW
ncbi:Serine/threonine-protein kinase Pkn1 [subsurface metagenome]